MSSSSFLAWRGIARHARLRDRARLAPLLLVLLSACQAGRPSASTAASAPVLDDAGAEGPSHRPAGASSDKDAGAEQHSPPPSMPSSQAQGASLKDRNIELPLGGNLQITPRAGALLQRLELRLNPQASCYESEFVVTWLALLAKKQGITIASYDHQSLELIVAAPSPAEETSIAKLALPIDNFVEEWSQATRGSYYQTVAALRAELPSPRAELMQKLAESLQLRQSASKSYEWALCELLELSQGAKLAWQVPLLGLPKEERSSAIADELASRLEKSWARLASQTASCRRSYNQDQDKERWSQLDAESLSSEIFESSSSTAPLLLVIPQLSDESDEFEQVRTRTRQFATTSSEESFGASQLIWVTGNREGLEEIYAQLIELFEESGRGAALLLLPEEPPEQGLP